MGSSLFVSKYVTAKRVRQRFGAVIKWAVEKGCWADHPASFGSYPDSLTHPEV